MIPYDALGMELTSDYKARVSLFSVKVLFNFAGYLVPNAAGLVLAYIFPTDIISLYAFTAMILGVLSVAALLVLVCCVQERPVAAIKGQEDLKVVEGVPPVVALRRALNNKPYRIYLAMKIPISIVGLIPANMAPYLLRYGMKMENWSSFYFTFLIVVLSASFTSTPFVALLMRRYGKREVLLYSAGLFWPVFIGFFLWPPLQMPTAAMLFMGVIFGFAAVLTFASMDAMLADVIDYDTLHTGRRSEGVYTVAETNLQQFIEVFAGVVPLLLMNAVGFENNGGCSCGCGVACASPYERWRCPGDIAYACTSGFSSPPLYGDTDRSAPCVDQPSEGVGWVVRFFIFLLCGLCMLLVFTLAKLYPISRKVHADILDATEALDAGRPANDPITGQPITRSSASLAALQLEHFTADERKQMGGLVSRLMLRLGVWLTVFVSFVIAMVATSGSAQQYVVSLCAICCSAIFVLVPYDALRLKVARQLPADGSARPSVKC